MAGALTATQIAALAAMVAGSYMQYDASKDAQKRQNNEIQRSLESQKKLQMEAEKKALGEANKFKTEDRNATQAELATNIEKELIAPVSESQAIRSEQQTTQGDVSSDYTTAKAASEVETMKQAQQLARLLGKTTSSGRLRMGEGIRMMDTGQGIDQLAGFSRGQGAADNIAIQRAGMLDPEKVFTGQLLSSAGSAGLMMGGGGGGGKAVYGSNATPTIAAEPGLAPVYDVSRVGTTGGGGGSWFGNWTAGLNAARR